VENDALGQTAQERFFVQSGESINSVQIGTVLNQAPRLQAGAGKDAKPFLKSLLIPGWGQYSQGRKNQALLFFGLEVSFWGGMAGVQAYGKSLEGDYRAYAVSHADIDASGKTHDFYVNIGNYDNQSEYNAAQQISRDYEALYIGEEYYWQWDSDGNRETFDNLRVKSDLYKNSAIYFAGAIVINHLASAIDAARHSRIKDSLQAGVRVDASGNGMLTIIKGL